MITSKLNTSLIQILIAQFLISVISGITIFIYPELLIAAISSLIILQLLFCIYFFRETEKKYAKSLYHIIKITKGFSFGKIDKKIKINKKSIYKPLAESINKSISNVKMATNFATAIGEGNLNIDYTSLNKDDLLGNALVEMRDKLIKVSQDENKRNWVTTGLAKFGEILRDNYNSIDDFCYVVLQNTIKYAGCNQGGIFLTSKNKKGEDQLELKASYAYERRKYEKKTIQKGEGLLGQCLLEKDVIFLTDVPKNYINITSGLGDATPSCVTIIPLKVQDEILGVIELASFEILDEFKMSFLNTLCESIASTLSTTQTNINTQRLLDEAKVANEELMNQEEELRQNQEEMVAIQEELNFKLKEVEKETSKNNSILEAISKTIAYAEFDLERNFVEVNNIFSGVTGFKESEIIGQNVKKVISNEEFEKPQFQLMWSNLIDGQFFSGEFKMMNSEGNELWLKGTYNPIKNGEGVTTSIIMLAQFTTEDKFRENELNTTLKVLKQSFPIIELNPDLSFKSANEPYLHYTGFKRLQLKKMNFSDLTGNTTNGSASNLILSNMNDKKNFESDFEFINTSGELHPFHASFHPITDINNKLNKIIVMLKSTHHQLVNVKKDESL